MAEPRWEGTVLIPASATDADRQIAILMAAIFRSRKLLVLYSIEARGYFRDLPAEG